MVGTQDIQGHGFAITRQISTGSWLGRKFQRQGIGTAMRAAVLEFAFRGLGATVAGTGAFVDNPASLRITRKLGYTENGTKLHAVAGEPRLEQRFLLSKEDWRCPIEVRIDGLESCRELLGAATTGMRID